MLSKENKKFILVATHPRSGTHFLINAICRNFKDIEFPLIRETYPSLEGLFWNHDEEYTKEWSRCIKEDNGKIKIFKTHLTPLEIILALNSEYYLDKEEKAIIKTIYENSKILYVYRDGRDVLVSWYYFHKNDGGGAIIQGGRDRIRTCSISEFIRMPNQFYLPIKGFSDKDINRVIYWSHHVNEWLSKKDVIPVAYESLRENFESTLKNLSVLLKMEHQLKDEIKKPQFSPGLKLSIFSRGLRKIKRLIEPILGYLGIRSSKIIAPPSYQRKGISGDWRNHFSNSDLEFFLKFAKDTMAKLNYKI